MALDGGMLYLLQKELSPLAGSRVDKISQPAGDSLVLHLRGHGQACRLLLSAGPSAARMHLTQTSPENPKSPPMFCMLLRKHLGGARFAGFDQPGLERVVFLRFEGRNEMGDVTYPSLVLEIMGRHSNLILLDEHKKILDAIKRVDITKSAVRQILPGMLYELPPAQNKEALTEADIGDLISGILSAEQDLSAAILSKAQGLSPILCREASFAATGTTDRAANCLTPGEKAKLTDYLTGLQSALTEGKGIPTMVSSEGKGPFDIAFMPIRQYGTMAQTQQFDSYSELLDAYYGKRDLQQRMKSRSDDMSKTLSALVQRTARKLQVWYTELESCKDREKLLQMGDLIHANLYRIGQGDTVVQAEDFYHPGEAVSIPLDSMLTPAQNAQKYYAAYRKADTAEKKLTVLIREAQQELAYLESVSDLLTRATASAELDSIREELTAQRYLKVRSRKGHKQMQTKLPPLQFISSDGFTILCGRGNLQNDQLTLKTAKKQDIWMHTQKIPGSHVIVVTDGKTPPDKTLEEAAIVAAYHSRARGSGKVPVDYVLAGQVKKPKGSPPGYVVYENYQTVVVTPDESLVQSLVAQ